VALTRALENVGENHDISFEAGADPGGVDWGDRPP